MTITSRAVVASALAMLLIASAPAAAEPPAPKPAAAAAAAPAPASKPVEPARAEAPRTEESFHGVTPGLEVVLADLPLAGHANDGLVI